MWGPYPVGWRLPNF